MIIHSIVSLDDIFFEQVSYSTSLIPIRYGFVEVNSDRSVRRIISTNPGDYLNAAYQPCSKLKI